MTIKAEVRSQNNAVIEQWAKNEQNSAIKMSMQVVTSWLTPSDFLINVDFTRLP